MGNNYALSYRFLLLREAAMVNYWFNDHPLFYDTNINHSRSDWGNLVDTKLSFGI